MERQNGYEPKDVSEKQRALLDELVNSDELEDAERRAFGRILRNNVSGSRDASVLISHILGLLNFRRQFGSD